MRASVVTDGGDARLHLLLFNFTTVTEVTSMPDKKRIDKLSSLIDQSHKLALQLDQTMAAYLLSMASLEVAEAIEDTESERSTSIAPSPLQ